MYYALLLYKLNNYYYFINCGYWSIKKSYKLYKWINSEPEKIIKYNDEWVLVDNA